MRRTSISTPIVEALPSKATWFDHLAESFFRWLNGPLVRQIGGEVARECRAAVFDRVVRPAQGMSTDQIRGYVRAVAPELVAEEVDAAMSRRRASGSLRPIILAEAVEQLITMATADLTAETWQQAAAIQKAA